MFGASNGKSDGDGVKHLGDVIHVYIKFRFAADLVFCWFYFAALYCIAPAAASEIVSVGQGSYALRPPANAKIPQRMIYALPAVGSADNEARPMPTNDWWSSLAWMPFSERQYPHPLAVKAESNGFRVFYPGPTITANDAAIFGFMPAAGFDDFVIGHSAVDAFKDARVGAFSDWFVTAVLGSESDKQLEVTYGHGSPFVFVRVEKGDPTMTFSVPPNTWRGGEDEPTLGITVGGRHYGVFGPSGSSWSDLDKREWTNCANGKGYFSVAVLPDASAETLDLFRRFAHNHVTDTRVAWRYDERTSIVETTFSFTTASHEGQENGTLFALYPHQWQHTTAQLLDRTYDSVRGPMKLGEGSSFATRMRFPGILPTLPDVGVCDRARMRVFIDEVVQEKVPSVMDTYWLGKQLGKRATLIPIAEQAGDRGAVDALLIWLKSRMEDFLAARDSRGRPKQRSLFYYDRLWGTLIGYPASYGSDSELNDHHFHYGYFVRAAAEIAQREPAWASDERWGAMVQLLVRDIASPDPNDAMFPFLRCFDPYAGHSWASGHGKFGDGNNNESSSEAMNAWYGIILWAAATGDRRLRDLGIYLYTTEMHAIEDYWFDVTGRFHHAGYAPSAVTMVWGGKGANETWFSANPEMVHGINWLPMHAGSLYLGRYPSYVRRNYAALVEENKGTQWDAWSDLVWMYLALDNPGQSVREFQQHAYDYPLEAGNSRANAYHWIRTLDSLGRVDRSIHADSPFYAVFTKNGRKTHVAYNMSAEPRVIKFSDGTMVTCASESFAVNHGD